MCGIVGYIGKKNCKQIIFNGLKRLEYRGYDSAGIAVLDGGNIEFIKASGKLKELEKLMDQLPNSAVSGIGHTRWATHGSPSTINAHPHVFGKLALIHNGIIENYGDLKTGLELAGISFHSETDTEVALMMLNKELEEVEKQVGHNPSNIKQAIINTTSKLKGTYSFGVIYSEEPDALYLVKHGTPLAIGKGEEEMFFASDVSAFVEYTKKAVFLHDGEFARISSSSIEVYNFSCQPVEHVFVDINMRSEELEKGGYAHYMLKEICEQPMVLSSIIDRLVDKTNSCIKEEALGLDKIDVRGIRSVHVIGCGTAFYSGYTIKYALEELTGISVNLELASEFRYRGVHLDPSSLVIAISQSGETADTLAALKYAKEHGAKTYCVCNVYYSSIPREADFSLYMDAGPEIGVASTKAFTGMVLCNYLLAIGIASRLKDKKNIYSKVGFSSMLKQMYYLPSLIEGIVSGREEIKEISNKYYNSSNFLYIGRGSHYSIALEGALKLKEISYIHAEGYAAGELKHGPIALIDSSIPVVALIPNDRYFPKTESNMEEVKARDGRVIGVGDREKISKVCESVLRCPQIEDPYLQSILSVIVLQLFAYYIANRRGTDVDQPRNLAKSVTVE